MATSEVDFVNFDLLTPLLNKKALIFRSRKVPNPIFRPSINISRAAGTGGEACHAFQCFAGRIGRRLGLFRAKERPTQILGGFGEVLGKARAFLRAVHSQAENKQFGKARRRQSTAKYPAKHPARFSERQRCPT